MRFDRHPVDDVAVLRRPGATDCWGWPRALPQSCRSAFVLFADRGKSQAFRQVLQDHGQETVTLCHDTPHLPAMVRELTSRLRELDADILCCHGYKADIVGLLAARRACVPVIAMSHGWTAETWKVRIYEALDRACLRRMDRVVCVSEGQAEKVRRAGVRPDRVLRSSATRSGPSGSITPIPRTAACWRRCFPRPPSGSSARPGGSAPRRGSGSWSRPRRSWPGRIREPGSSTSAMARSARRSAGGSGSSAWNSGSSWPGFRDDLDRFLPHWDLSVLPSFTEGLPTVVLESYAAGVPVVATAVGGTPEAVADGVDGYLVPPGDPSALARRILDVLESVDRRRHMGMLGRERIRAEFTFEAQALRFQGVCEALVNRRREGKVIDHLVPNSGATR